jgi:hypothetical protein
MKRLAAAVAFAVLAAQGGPAAAGSQAAKAAPAIRVEPESFDFGRALPGRTLRKEFTLRNAGEAELVIDKVSTTCGCTAAIVGAQRLRPGRSTTLSVTLATRDARGRLARRVLVRSNDPKTPLLEVEVSATVEAPAGTAKK